MACKSHIAHIFIPAAFGPQIGVLYKRYKQKMLIPICLRTNKNVSLNKIPSYLPLKHFFWLVCFFQAFFVFYLVFSKLVPAFLVAYLINYVNHVNK